MSRHAAVVGSHTCGWQVWLLVPALMVPLVGCSVSDDPNAWYNKTVVENLSGRSDAPPAAPTYTANIPATPAAGGAAAIPPAGPVSASAAASGPTAPPRVPLDGELYRSEASCGGSILGTGAPPSVAASQSISLDMTECEVARRLGPPDRMELGGAGGQRLLTLTYARGEHPRLYRFAGGRLYAIEALPPPAVSARKPR